MRLIDPTKLNGKSGYVLGYSQPSLRDSILEPAVLTQTPKRKKQVCQAGRVGTYQRNMLNHDSSASA
jgi:hypothetical protein